jgi:tight adherence protein C
VRRQIAAEEKAMKAPIKLLVPMIVFIFPSLFILVLGPVLMTIRDNL